MKNLNLNTALLIVVAVLVTLQVKSCIEPTPVSREVVEAQVKLKQYEKELPSIREELDFIYARYDSLLLASVQRYEDLERRKQPIQYAIKQVPVIVGNYDREQLRRAYAGYDLPAGTDR